jgi:hypothetical protein
LGDHLDQPRAGAALMLGETLVQVVGPVLGFLGVR